MERFIDLTFLVVRRDEAQVTECWRPDKVAKQALVALGWPEEVIWQSEKRNQEARPSAIILKNE
jgi:hypothetical protein